MHDLNTPEQRKLVRLNAVARAAIAVVERHDWDAAIPDTPTYELRMALVNAGKIAPVEQVKGTKPLILYFANDEDRTGFIEAVKGVFSNPVEMDVP